ncbi:Helix-destabilizing protein [uncultured Flavonifractor sp.]|nr:Helix-destabilizing protein [uncultured Flavonifractor sp.]
MLNRIILMGRLTRDPELRHTQTGTPVASFSLAVDRDFKDKQTGEKATDFIDIVAWRQTAEFVSRFFTKGRLAVVEGRLQIRDWTDRDGGKRRSAEVIADNVYFGDSKRDAEAGGYSAPSYGPQGGYAPPPAPAPSTGYAAPAGPAGNEFGDLADDDGELPF